MTPDLAHGSHLTVLVLPFPKDLHRDAVLAALGADDDEDPPSDSATVEVGVPATGATCAIVDDAVHVPLIRSPTSATDLLPAIAAAFHVDAAVLLAQWQRAHVDACRAVADACAAAGSPLPPHLPRASLERLHALLVDAHARSSAGVDVAHPVVGVVTGDAVVVAAPRAGLVPPVDAVFADGALHRVSLADFTDAAAVALGAPLPPGRVVSCVEIVDDESLFG